MKPVGVQFNQPSKVHYFDAGDLELANGDTVVVKTESGNALGKVLHLKDNFLDDAKTAKKLPPIIRIATNNDHQQIKRNQRRELDAFSICQKIAREMELPMKLVKAQFTLGGGKVTYYFHSENRIDFRHLVKRLNQELGMTVEMNQIGVRDAAGMVGGIGVCGREYCCASFLTSFKPVSIKMAKTQNLSLNPEKVSGGCGRLRCCLTYELDTYHELAKNLPRVGKRIETKLGAGKVKSVEILRGSFTVDLGEEAGSVSLKPVDLI